MHFGLRAAYLVGAGPALRDKTHVHSLAFTYYLVGRLCRAHIEDNEVLFVCVCELAVSSMRVLSYTGFCQYRLKDKFILVRHKVKLATGCSSSELTAAL